jgi:hypothetical protein
MQKCLLITGIIKLACSPLKPELFLKRLFFIRNSRFKLWVRLLNGLNCRLGCSTCFDKSSDTR